MTLRFFHYAVCVLNDFKIAKLVMSLFLLFSFCILHAVLICIVHNCLRAWLPVLFHFHFVCAIPCLPYFLQYFCALLHSFLLQNCSLLHFLLLCRFLPVQLARLSRVFCRCTFRFDILEVKNNVALRVCFTFVVADAHLLFFWQCLVTIYFCNFWPWVTTFVRPCFAVSFCLPVCFLAFSLGKRISPGRRTPCSPCVARLEPP